MLYANNLLQQVRDANRSTVFWQATSTDAWGHIQDEAFGNGVATFTDFDQANGWMEARQGGIGGGTGLLNATTSWDVNGNLTQRQDRTTCSDLLILVPARVTPHLGFTEKATFARHLCKSQ